MGWQVYTLMIETLIVLLIAALYRSTIEQTVLSILVLMTFWIQLVQNIFLHHGTDKVEIEQQKDFQGLKLPFILQIAVAYLELKSSKLEVKNTFICTV